MTDKPTLDRLIAAIEAGTLSDDLVSASPFCRDNFYAGYRVTQAYHGSLDAALSLHEALLPGWGWRKADWRTSEVHVVDPDKPHVFGGPHDTSPARALLLATLKAHRQQISETTP